MPMRNAQSALSVISECAEAYESLYKSQEELLDFMREKSCLVDEEIIRRVPAEDRDLNACYKRVHDFSETESFWNEVVILQADHDACDSTLNGAVPVITYRVPFVETLHKEEEIPEVSNQSLASPNVNEAVNPEDLLSAIVSCGDAQQILAMECADLIDLCKGSTQDVPPLLYCNPVLEATEKEISPEFREIIAEKEPVFYAQVLQMQEEVRDIQVF